VGVLTVMTKKNLSNLKLLAATFGAALSYNASAVIAGSYDTIVASGVGAYYVVIINESGDDVFIGNKSQFRYNNGGLFQDTWADVTSKFNEEWVGTDPDFIKDNEMAMGANIFFDDEDLAHTTYSQMTAWQNTASYTLGTFGMKYQFTSNNEYADMENFYAAAAWNTYSSGLNYFNELEDDFEFRLEYGCRAGQSDYTKVNAEKNMSYSPHFENTDALSGGKTAKGAWDDVQGNKYVVYALINDCSGDVTWGTSYYDVYNKSRGIKEAEWSEWTNSNQATQLNDSPNESEPVPGFCSAPVEIQCRKSWHGSDYQDFKNMTLSSGISGAFVYSCDVDQGLQCNQSDQKTDLNYWQNTSYNGAEWHTVELGYKQACGDWEVRVRCDNSADTSVDLSSTSSTGVNFDQTSAAGNDDHELTLRHLEAGNITPIQASVEPAFIEVPGITDVKTPSNEFFARTTYGVVINNDNDSSATHDYEVKFHYGWTPWINNNQSGTNDKEYFWRYTVWQGSTPTGSENTSWRKGLMPNRNPEITECRAVGYNKVFTHNTATSNGFINADMGDGNIRKFKCNTEIGYECFASDNPSTGCIDAQVRYYFNTYEVCNGNIDDGLDNSSCDASSGSVIIKPYLANDLCIGTEGSLNLLVLQACGSVTEQWLHDQTTGNIHPAGSTDLCLGKEGSTGGIQTTSCAEAFPSQFDYEPKNGMFYLKGGTEYCLGISGIYSDGSVENYGMKAGTQLKVEKCDDAEAFVMNQNSAIKVKSPVLALTMDASTYSGRFLAKAGQAYDLIATTHDQGGAIEYIYWDLDGDGNYASAELANFSGDFYKTHSWSRVGLFTVNAKGVNALGDEVVKSVDVKVTGTPDITLAAVSPEVSINDEIIVQAHTDTFGISITNNKWQINNSSTSNSGLEIIEKTNERLRFKAPVSAQAVQVNYSVGNAFGELASQEITIDVVQDPPSIQVNEVPEWVFANNAFMVSLEVSDNYGSVASKSCEMNGQIFKAVRGGPNVILNSGNIAGNENSFKCSVTDDDGNTTWSDPISVEVVGNNKPEIAITNVLGVNASNQTSINDVVEFTFNVSDVDGNLSKVSLDLDGDAVFEQTVNLDTPSYNWSQISSASFDAIGTYTISIQATDVSGHVSNESMSIDVIADVPIVDIQGLDNAVLLTAYTLNLQGEVQQEFGSISSQLWIVENSAGQTEYTDTNVLALLLAVEGEYKVTYQVTDDDGHIVKKVVTFSVIKNFPPELNVIVNGLYKGQASIKDEVTFEVTVTSTEDDLMPLAIDFDGDGIFETTATVIAGQSKSFTKAWSTPLNFNVGFSIEDSAGQTATYLAPIDIVLDAPIVEANANALDRFVIAPANEVRERYNLDGHTYGERFGNIVSYYWEVSEYPLSDSTIVNAVPINKDNPLVTRYENVLSVEHMFRYEGEHIAKLTVEDDDGNIVTDETKVVISDKGTQLNWQINGVNDHNQASINDVVELNFSWSRLSPIGYYYCKLNGETIIDKGALYDNHQAPETTALYYEDNNGNRSLFPYKGTIQLNVTPDKVGTYNVLCGVEEKFSSTAESVYSFEIVQDTPEIAISGLENWQSNQQAMLAGVVVKEEFGEIVNWQWHIEKDADGVVYLTSNEQSVQFIPEPGDYTIRLTATDDDGNAVIATGTATLTNNKPTLTLTEVTGYSDGSNVYLDGQLTVSLLAADIDNNLDKLLVDRDGDGVYESQSSIAYTGETLVTLSGWSNIGNHNASFKAVDSSGVESQPVSINYSVLDNKEYSVEVWGHDIFFGSSSRSQVHLQVKNTGLSSLSGLEIRYYFTADNDKTMKAQSTYKANADFNWGHLGDDQYFASFTLGDISLAPGEVSPRGSYFGLLAHYSDWSDTWNVANDCSYVGVNSDDDDSLLTHVAVYHKGVQIYGESCDDFDQGDNGSGEPSDIYTVNVTGGEGAGEYSVGETVSLRANQAPGGYIFSHWQSNVTLADENASSSTFVMPNFAVDIEAIFIEDASSGDCVSNNCDESDPIDLGERSNSGVELELTGTMEFVVKAENIPNWLKGRDITLIVKAAGDGAMNGVVLEYPTGSYQVPDGKWWASASADNQFPNDLVFTVSVPYARKLIVDWQ